MAKVTLIDRLSGRVPKDRMGFDGLLAQQEPLNLGSLFDIRAKEPGLSGLNKFGDPVRILNIEGEDADSDSILVTLQNEAVFLGPSSTPVPGPLIGIVEYGTGSGYARVEFDIPSAVGGPAPNIPAGAGIDLGTIFTPQKNNIVSLLLPASSIRVFVRNDAQTGYLVDFNGTTVNGNPASRATAGQVRVHAAYGDANMVREKVYRQYWIAGPGAPLAAGDVISVGIPAFAKRVWFPRSPLATQPLNIVIGTYYDGANVSLITQPAGDLSYIDLPPHVSVLQISNPVGNPGSFSNLSAIFELGF